MSRNSSSKMLSATSGAVEKYSLHIKPGAVAGLEEAPLKARRQLMQRIRKLNVYPVAEGCERVSGAGKYRLRHEEYRIVYSVDQEALRVVVASIARRQTQTGSQ